MIIDILLFYCEGRGGVEDVTSKISKELIKMGHRVRIFQAYRPQYPEWEKNISEFYFFGKYLSWGSPIDSYVNNYLDMAEKLGLPDIVLSTHETFCNRLCFKALKENRKVYIPFISWIHSQVHVYADPFLLSYSDSHLAITDAVKSGLCQMFSPETVHVVGNPIETKGLPICERPKDKLSLLFVGRLENRGKRLDVIFNALTKVKFPWELTIIGNGRDYDYLRNLSSSLNISDNIKWLGWKSRPWDSVKKASLLLLTSDYEGFGLVTAEALARGIPAICTEGACPHKLIEDNKNGWIIKNGDYMALASILNKISEGILKLPEPDSCIKSVEKYDVSSVAKNIEKVLIDEYKKNKYRLTLDIVLPYMEDGTNLCKTMLNLYKGLISKGHRIRVFAPCPSQRNNWETAIIERYYYAPNCSTISTEYGVIEYSKLINNIGLPDALIMPINDDVSILSSKALKSLSCSIPVSLIMGSDFTSKSIKNKISFPVLLTDIRFNECISELIEKKDIFEISSNDSKNIDISAANNYILYIYNRFHHFK